MTAWKRPLIAAAWVMSSLLGAQAVQAAGYPERPIKIVVPYTPGSGPDVVARSLGGAMGGKLGTTFIVDNRPGANGTIGIDTIAKAAPDGYTIGLVVNSFSMNPSLYAKSPNPLKAFQPLGLVARGSMVLVARPSLRVQDLKSLVAAAHAKPGGLMYATPGNGSPQHLATVQLGQALGMELTHVPYRGSGPAVTAALSGEVDLMFMPVHTAAPFLQDGRLRAVMVSTKDRSPRLPNVPTARELGLQGFDVDLWYAVVAPAGLPAEAAARLTSAVEGALKDATVQSGFEGQGLEPVYLDPAGFTQLLQKDIGRWADVIKRARIVVE